MIGRTGLIAALAGLAILVGAEGVHAAGGGGGGDDGYGGGGGTIYVKVRPVTVSVLNDRGLSGRVSAVFVLQAHDAQAEADIAAAEVHLRNAYLQAMHRLVEEETLTGQLISLSRVKARLKRASDRVVGKGAVEEVLIQTLVRRSERQ